MVLGLNRHSGVLIDDSCTQTRASTTVELEDAARNAMHVFWDRGYEGASLPDLIEGTGLSRESLYKAFGDKKGLLLAALDIYCAQALKLTADILSQSGTARQAIHESLDAPS